MPLGSGGTVGLGVTGCPVRLDPEPPRYYQVELVSTRKVPGAGQAEGWGNVSFQASPFGISMTPDGSYRYDLDIEIHNLLPARQGEYVAWVTTPDLKNVKRLGKLDERHRLKSQVDWNKFLIVITLEPESPADGSIWQGPVVLRGLSRSGFMHTMAGHGPYEIEPCALFGF
jgi:hypothetical protein